jgi:DNA gyrase inhibitor GyrI
VTRPTVIDEDAFDVARVEAVGGPPGAAAAFDHLESTMPTLRGQKMYGVLYLGDPDRYFAGLRLDDEASPHNGLERATIPGGLYGRRLVRDWNTKIPELPEIFDALTADLTSAGYLVDRTRPLIEYYRRVDELVIMVPVLDGAGAN